MNSLNSELGVGPLGHLATHLGCAMLHDEGSALRRVLDALPQIIWSARTDGFHDFHNGRWYEHTGMLPGSTVGDGWTALLHPEDQPDARARWNQSLATGAQCEMEYRLRSRDGSYRWTLGRAVPIRNAGGRILRWLGTCTDIEALKSAEARAEMISHELTHRIRNIFAVVNSLLAMSSRDQPDALPFADATRARIDSLARAHDYIHGHDVHPSTSSCVTLHGLLDDLLAPYAQDGGKRISAKGIDVPLGNRAATSLALVIHELATNAVKHGSLADSTGRLDIETEVEADRHVSLVWRERGGPPVAGEPTRKGYGTTLSELALKTPLGAELSREWDPDGLTVRIRIPVPMLAH